MAKGENQKLKLFYLAKIMREKTDEDHFLTLAQIQEELEKYGVKAERKSLYTDFKELEKLGYEIEGESVGRGYHYHLLSHEFELAELKLLVDAIQSSKFITEKKSHQLIKKLEGLVSEYEAKQLRRQVYVTERIKTMNESIYYNVDAIYSAINENKKIRFQYFQWNQKKEMQLRHDGEFYEISPWGLSWDDENYYLIAYDSRAGKIKHYRVDKMLKISKTENEREGEEHFQKETMASYAKKSFGMFGGEEKRVKLLVENSMAGVIIDRFGKEESFIPYDANHFTVNVDVHVSRQFLGWVISLGEKVKIVSPDSVLDEMNCLIDELIHQYRK